MTTLKTLVYGIGFSAALALAGTPALSHANPAPAAQQQSTGQGSSSMPTESEMLEMRDAASALEDFRGGDRSYVITGTTIVIILLVILLLIIIL